MKTLDYKPKASKQYLPKYLAWILKNQDVQNKKHMDYSAMYKQK